MIQNTMQVTPNTARTFEDLNTGFRFRVVGDGKVEPELADRFSSPGFIENIDDRRLQTFAKDQLACATHRDVEISLKESLGEQWTISNYYSGGTVFAARVDVELIEPGAGRQVISLDNRDMAVHLTTTAARDGWTIEHSINGSQGQSEWTEAATFQHP